MHRSKMPAAVIFVLAIGFVLAFAANVPSAYSQDRSGKPPQAQSPPPPHGPTPTMQKGTSSAERTALIGATKACRKACRDKYIAFGINPATGKPNKVPQVDQKGLAACVAKCPKCVSNTDADCD